jgi:hypothetical protein
MMQNIITSIRTISLYLLLVVVGLYAGMLFNHKICPVETQLNPIDYAKYWKIVDGTFMHERMAIMGPGMGVLFLITILLFIKNWRSWSFLFLAFAFIAFALDINFAFKEQLPINAFINELDLKNITPQQTLQLTEFQAKAITNFDTRFVHAMLSFFLLSMTPFFLPQLNKKLT